MKKFLSVLIVLILLVSAIGITTALAGASISGGTTIYAGRTYKYTVKISGTASSIGGVAKCSGVFSGSNVTLWKDSNDGHDASLSASATITVKVASGATVGQTGTIIIDAAGAREDGTEFNLDASKTYTVQLAPTPDPNATPKPLEGWEIVEAAIDEAQDGAILEAEMEDDYKIPSALLTMLIEKKIVLVIDFGTYNCTIDPEKLTDFDDIGSLDLSLMFEKVAGLSQVAGEMDLYQLHFGHSGVLPGLLSFTFKASENEPGDVVFLYYYYGEADVVEGKASALVDENGMVTFDIYHCSSYFVTGEVLPAAMSNFDSESALALEQMGLELEDAQEMAAHTQTALDDSNAQVDKLSGDLEEAQAALTAALEAGPEETVEVALEPEKAPMNVSMVVFIAALVAVLLLSILLTMMFCKAGLFRRVIESEASEVVEEEPMTHRSEARMSRQQAKRDAMDAKQRAKQDAFDMKEQIKQDAIDAKHQEKLDKMEAKRRESEAKAQAKQDAIDAKAQAKQDAADAKAQAKQAKKAAKGKDSDTQI